MPTPTTFPRVDSGDAGNLPVYAAETTAFHQAFASELRAAVGSLPLTPTMQVLDVCCGDGFYTRLLAERLTDRGHIIGADRSSAYLTLAERRCAADVARCSVRFIACDLASLPPECCNRDLIWSAQSLYSLPEPVMALRQMAAAARPGGLVAVLENDTLHQLLLPWPEHLELALRAAEFLAFADESLRPTKYYVGRRLPMVFAAAGLEPLGFRTQCIDRQAPLDPPLEAFLQSYLARLAERVSGRLDPRATQEFAELIDPGSPRYLLRQPHFTMSWLNVLTWGRRPQ